VRLLRFPIFFDWVECDVSEECKFDMYLGGADDGVALRFFWNGHYERYSIKIWCELAKSANCILDIGAHTGCYTLAAQTINRSASVFSFEPNSQCYSRLMLNLRANNLTTNFAHMVACCEKDDVAFFSIKTPSGYLSSGGKINEKDQHSYQIKTISIDNMLYKKCDKPINLIKIDVEGHENLCLKGMNSIISRDHPIILFECVEMSSSMQCYEYLTNIGYKIFLVDELLESIRIVDNCIPIIGQGKKIDMYQINRIAVHSDEINFFLNLTRTIKTEKMSNANYPCTQ